MNPLNLLAGYRTKLAALGLVGLALYQFTQGDMTTAWQSLMAALAAYGLRKAQEGKG